MGGSGRTRNSSRKKRSSDWMGNARQRDSERRRSAHRRGRRARAAPGCGEAPGDLESQRGRDREGRVLWDQGRTAAAMSGQCWPGWEVPGGWVPLGGSRRCVCLLSMMCVCAHTYLHAEHRTVPERKLQAAGSGCPGPGAVAPRLADLDRGVHTLSLQITEEGALPLDAAGRVRARRGDGGVLGGPGPAWRPSGGGAGPRREGLGKGTEGTSESGWRRVGMSVAAGVARRCLPSGRTASREPGAVPLAGRAACRPPRRPFRLPMLATPGGPWPLWG